jgi:cyanophycin synthetase
LQKLIENMDSSRKVGIITGIGDRRKEDTEEVGRIACETFDDIIIRVDRNLRGKTKEEIIDMLKAGIHQVDENKNVTVIPNENDAIDYAIKNAQPNSLIVLFSDAIETALKQLTKYKEDEAHQLYQSSGQEFLSELGLNNQEAEVTEESK